jgi:hypothetical protein
VSDTEPVEDVPPVNDVGFKAKELITAAVTVKAAVWVVPQVPEMVSGVLTITELVVTVNVAVLAFAATVTCAGT